MSLKIMVVDEEPRSVPLLRALATPLGHTVMPFGDYQAAAKKSESQPFDVAFVGMRPPQMNGIDLAHQIRNSQPNRKAAIVMLTASEDISVLRRAFGEGADFVLTEPVQGGRLHRMLSAMNTPGWKERRPAARLPLNVEVVCSWLHRQQPLSSLNISESGMLLRPLPDAPVGEQISLQFRIAEVNASVNATARIIRKDEASELVGVEFVDLPREALNAIQIYVLGRSKEADSSRTESLNLGPRRLYNS